MHVEVSIASDDGPVDSWIQVTREDAASLGIKAGDGVFVRKADTERISAPSIVA